MITIHSSLPYSNSFILPSSSFPYLHQLNHALSQPSPYFSLLTGTSSRHESAFLWLRPHLPFDEPLTPLLRARQNYWMTQNQEGPLAFYSSEGEASPRFEPYPLQQQQQQQLPTATVDRLLLAASPSSPNSRSQRGAVQSCGESWLCIMQEILRSRGIMAKSSLLAPATMNRCSSRPSTFFATIYYIVFITSLPSSPQTPSPPQKKKWDYTLKPPPFLPTLGHCW